METKKKTGRFRKLMSMALAFVMVFGAMMPLATEKAHA